MQINGLYVGKSETHLYFSNWYGSPNFRVHKDKQVQYRISEKNKKLVTFKNLEDVELLPRGFDFSKVISKRATLKNKSE